MTYILYCGIFRLLDISFFDNWGDFLTTIESDDLVHIESIDVAISSGTESVFIIGYHLSFLSHPYEIALSRWGFSRTTVKNYVAIVSRFSDRGCSFKVAPEFSEFSYTQLVAMLPFSDEDIKNVTSAMTVSQIKALRKSDQSVGQSKQKYSASPDVLFEGFVSARTWDSLLDKLYEFNDSPKKLRVLVLEPDITDYASGAAFPAGVDPAE